MLYTLVRVVLAALVVSLAGCGKSEPTEPVSIVPEGPDPAEEARIAKEAQAAKEAEARKHIENGTKALASGDKDAAIGHFKQAASANPIGAEAHLQLARVFVAKENDEGALTEFTEAIRLDPRLIGAYMDRAALHERAGRGTEAGYDYYRVIDIDPDRKTTARAFWLRSSIADGLGKREDFRHDRERAMQLDPEYKKQVIAGDVRVFNHTGEKIKIAFEKFVNPDGKLRAFPSGFYFMIPEDTTVFLMDGNRYMPARSVRFKLTTGVGSKTFEYTYDKGMALEVHIYETDLPRL